MTAKLVNVFTCILLFSLFITLDAISQQAVYTRPVGPGTEPIVNGHANGNYTYRVFSYPGKSFGYDILQNERVIYHQPLFSKSTINDKEILVNEQQAIIAAILAIEKLKKGMRPELTREEVIKIGATH